MQLGGDAVEAADGAGVLRFTVGGDLSGQPVIFNARYRGLGPTRRLAEIRSGSLEYFFTERYCLFTHQPCGAAVRANIHTMAPGRWKMRRPRSSRTICLRRGDPTDGPRTGAALLAPPGGVRVAGGVG